MRVDSYKISKPLLLDSRRPEQTSNVVGAYLIRLSKTRLRFSVVWAPALSVSEKTHTIDTRGPRKLLVAVNRENSKKQDHLI